MEHQTTFDSTEKNTKNNSFGVIPMFEFVNQNTKSKINKDNMIGPYSFEKTVREDLECYPDLQYLLTVQVNSKTKAETLSNLYLLINELIELLVDEDRINCLVIDVSIIEESVYVGLNHDKKGIDPNEFETLKRSNNSSISKWCELMNLNITFDIGSTTLDSSLS